MKLEQLPEGTRIYYGGDMANSEDFGIITSTEASTKWGKFINIKLDDGREMKRLPLCAFSDEYKGHGGTRFVTLEAYNAYRQAIANANGFPYQRAL